MVNMKYINFYIVARIFYLFLVLHPKFNNNKNNLLNEQENYDRSFA